MSVVCAKVFCFPHRPRAVGLTTNARNLQPYCSTAAKGRPYPLQAIMKGRMTLAQAFDEILDFLAAGTTTQSIADFRPSDQAQARVRELIERRGEAAITPAENEELEEYLRLEHLMIMAKARAQIRLRS